MFKVYEDIQANIGRMEGDFVLPKNSYEQKFCEILNWECLPGRYYDARDHSTFIEIKKGQAAMWLDLCRYAEIYLGEGQQDTITIFIKYAKKRKCVSEVYIIDTKDLIEKLGMNAQKAAMCIYLRDSASRGLNCQASLTAKDLKAISTYVVYKDNGP